MSLAVIVYLVGMALVFVAERLVADIEVARWTLDLLGAAAIVGSFILRWRRLEHTDNEGLAHGERTALALQAVGSGSLLLYVLSTDAVVALFDWSTVGESRWTGVWSALWPVVWLLGTFPLLLVDRAVEASPVVAPPQRIRRALSHGLAAALGLALVFPANYIASRHQESWDLAYFQAASPGTATRNIVASLTAPVHIRVFVEPHSELRQDLEDYFEELDAEAVTVTYHDQAAEPELARELRVRQNGQVAFSVEKSEKANKAKPDHPASEVLRLGSTRAAARDKLRDLDTEVRKHLLEIARGEKKVYLTVGHGELELGRATKDPTERLQILEKLLEVAQFDTGELSADSGLAEDIPEDADVVMVLAPKQPFMDAEIDALEAFLERGGSLFVALEPAVEHEGDGLVADGAPLGRLLEKLGVEMHPERLAAERGFLPVTHNKTDRVNLITDQFSSHPSTSVLSRTSPALMMFTPSAGHLGKAPKAEADVVFTVRTHRYTWADLDGDFEYDPKAGEKRKKYPLAAASEGGDDAGNWRAMIVADSSLLSDFGMRARGNQQFVHDTLNWLVETEEFSGTMESEKDVRIRHSKEDQVWWFYGTVLGIPLLLLSLGTLRIWWRKKGGKS